MDRAIGRGRRGRLEAQAAIELVMVLPILLIIMAFAVDIGNLWNSQSQLNAASSEGAKMLSADPAMTDAELAAELGASTGLGDALQVSVSRKDVSGKDVTMRSAGKTVQATYARKRATVEVAADVPTIMPLTLMGVDAASSGSVRITSASSTILSTLGRS